MSEVERLADLLDRALRAEKSLKQLTRGAIAKSAFAVTERHRLQGKAEGVALAAAYIREALHEAEQAAVHSPELHAADGEV